MDIKSLATAAGGDNLVGHVVTAAALGDGLSAIGVWGLQLAHLDPPAAAAQGITAISMVIASVVIKKVFGQ